MKKEIPELYHTDGTYVPKRYYSRLMNEMRKLKLKFASHDSIITQNVLLSNENIKLQAKLAETEHDCDVAINFNIELNNKVRKLQSEFSAAREELAIVNAHRKTEFKMYQDKITEEREKSSDLLELIEAARIESSWPLVKGILNTAIKRWKEV